VWHRVEVDGHEPRDRKGPLPRVQIALGRAAGHNKTTVSGLETFRIDPDDLARYGKRLFNCTASVAELPGKNVHEKEVTLQGHCVSELVDHLAKVYKLPRSLIDIKR
jgi:translation initiation factor 1 (eIF-1/SUI1)